MYLVVQGGKGLSCVFGGIGRERVKQRIWWCREGKGLVVYLVVQGGKGLSCVFGGIGRERVKQRIWW